MAISFESNQDEVNILFSHCVTYDWLTQGNGTGAVGLVNTPLILVGFNPLVTCNPIGVAWQIVSRRGSSAGAQE